MKLWIEEGKAEVMAKHTMAIARLSASALRCWPRRTVRPSATSPTASGCKQRGTWIKVNKKQNAFRKRIAKIVAIELIEWHLTNDS